LKATPKTLEVCHTVLTACFVVRGVFSVGYGLAGVLLLLLFLGVELTYGWYKIYSGTAASSPPAATLPPPTAVQPELPLTPCPNHPPGYESYEQWSRETDEVFGR
jgi:hypothetical protein